MDETEKRHEFKRNYLSFLELFLLIEPIIYSSGAIYYLWKFGLSKFLKHDGLGEFIFGISILIYFILYNIVVFVRPGIIIENDNLIINNLFRKRRINLSSILRADVGQSFYIYYLKDNGGEDGCFVPVKKESFSDVYKLLFKEDRK